MEHSADVAASYAYRSVGGMDQNRIFHLKSANETPNLHGGSSPKNDISVHEVSQDLDVQSSHSIRVVSELENRLNSFTIPVQAK